MAKIPSVKTEITPKGYEMPSKDGQTINKNVMTPDQVGLEKEFPNNKSFSTKVPQCNEMISPKGKDLAK